MILTAEQAQAVIDQGQHAAGVLSNEHFRATVEYMTSLHVSAIIAAPPGPRGADAVAYHHAIQHALTEILATLQGQVEAGLAQERRFAEAGDDEDDI